MAIRINNIAGGITSPNTSGLEQQRQSQLERQVSRENIVTDDCPPAGLPTDPGLPPAGEEPIGESNFGDIDFLAPIEEISTDEYQTGRAIREINLFDEYFFLRSATNLFSIDTAGNSVMTPPELSSQLYSSLLYKSPRISAHETTRTTRNSQPTSRQVGIDTFRTINNRFWCLEGAESAPIQEVWIDNRNRDTFNDRKYRIKIENIFSNERVELQYPDPNADDFGSVLEGFSQEYAQEQFSLNVPAGKTFIDTNTSIAQPLLKSETLQLLDDDIARKSYTIDFKTTVRQRVVETAENDRPEYRMKSLYRDYYRMVNPDYTAECDIEDRIQKYLSSNSEDMKSANASSELLERYPNYITIKISRPSNLLQNETPDPSLTVPNNLALTGYDKYILNDLFAGHGRVERNFIQVADETSPQSQQTVRVNDQFFVGFLPELRNGLITHVENHENFLSQRAPLLSSRAINYPLKFDNFDDADALVASDLQPGLEFANFLETQSRIEKRNYAKIFEGTKAKSAIIGYRIEKRNAASNNLLQTFYIMEPPAGKDVTPIEFLDTQVKYGQVYNYRIYSLSLVFGSEYRYNSTPAINESAGSIRFLVNTSPYVRLVEAPFFQKTVPMLDLPPLAPEVSFIPNQRNPKELSIIFNHNVGSKKDIPIAIREADAQAFSSMKLAQNIEPDEPIEYYSDTISETYEMFILSRPPMDYYDFSEGARVEIPVQNRLSVIHEMTLPETNKDYYFTFRAVEPTGISNPTPVYKFKMIDAPNGAFMILEGYDFVSEKPKAAKFDFERALKISPSVHQKFIKYPAGTDLSSREFALSAPQLSDLTLGVHQESIWGKKYKFRITSKKTGRKLDINTTFEKNTLDNVKVMEYAPADCDPLPDRRRQEGDPTSDCISDEMLKLPTLDASLRVEKSKTCADGSTISISHTETYKIDLNNIMQDQSGRAIGLLEYIKLRDSSIMNDCGCEENLDRYLDFIPPLAYMQDQRINDGLDFIAIFDTNGAVPKHIEESVTFGTAEQQTLAKQEAVRKEQRLWWTDDEEPSAAQLSAAGLYPKYFWETRDESGEEINQRQRNCLNKVKQAVRSLTMMTSYSLEQAMEILDGNSSPLTPAAMKAVKDAVNEIKDKPYQTVCAEPTVVIEPTFACDDKVVLKSPTGEILTFTSFQQETRGTETFCVAESQVEKTIKISCSDLDAKSSPTAEAMRRGVSTIANDLVLVRKFKFDVRSTRGSINPETSFANAYTIVSKKIDEDVSRAGLAFGETWTRGIIPEVDQWYDDNCYIPPEPDVPEEVIEQPMPGTTLTQTPEYEVELGVLMQFEKVGNPSQKAWDIVWSPEKLSLLEGDPTVGRYRTQSGKQNWFSFYMQNHMIKTPGYALEDPLNSGPTFHLPKARVNDFGVTGDFNGFQAVMNFLRVPLAATAPNALLALKNSMTWKDSWTISPQHYESTALGGSQFPIEQLEGFSTVNRFDQTTGRAINVEAGSVFYIGGTQDTYLRSQFIIGENVSVQDWRTKMSRFADGFWFGGDSDLSQPIVRDVRTYYPAEGIEKAPLHICVKITRKNIKPATLLITNGQNGVKPGNTFINNNGTSTFTISNSLLGTDYNHRMLLNSPSGQILNPTVFPTVAGRSIAHLLINTFVTFDPITVEVPLV